MNYWRKPLDLDKIEIAHGIIHIDKEQCKGCEFCIEYCPTDVLSLSKEFNRKGYHFPLVLHDSECINCNLCETICPEFAIFCKTGSPRNPVIINKPE